MALDGKNQLHILITRPEQEAARTAKKLEALGHEVTSVPLFDVVFHDLDDIDWQSVTAVLFTSANAAVAVSAWLDRSQKPAIRRAIAKMTCFVAGDHTARKAGPLGFKAVYSAGADAAALLKLVRGMTDPARDRLLHIRGADIAMDVVKHFKGQGYVCTDHIAYRMAPAEAAGDALARALSGSPRPIDTAAFFSARIAEEFARQVKAHSLESAVNTMTALCLSKRIAEKLKFLPFRDIRLAPHPTLEALIEALAYPRNG